MTMPSKKPPVDAAIQKGLGEFADSVDETGDFRGIPET